LVLSQYVEQIYARELLADGSGGVGYLLKDRVFDSAQFAEALRRGAGGGTAMDPEVISRLLAPTADDRGPGRVRPRERERPGRRAGPRPRSPRGWSPPSGPWPSPPRPSPPSGACSPPTTTTAASSPCSPTSAARYPGRWSRVDVAFEAVMTLLKLRNRNA